MNDGNAMRRTSLRGVVSRGLSLAFLLNLLTSFSPSAAGTTPAEYLFVESAAAHLGGDPFRIDSVRVNLEDGSAQVAHVRSDGVVLKLLQGVSNLKLEANPLPQPVPKEPEPSDAPPPPEIEGMGPVGIVAHGRPEIGVALRRFETDDPTRIEPLPEFVHFMTDVARSVSDTRTVGDELIFVQARPWGGVSRKRIRPNRRLTESEVDASVVLGNLFAHPFKLVPLPHAGDDSDGGNFVRSLAPGSVTIVEYAGRLFTMAVYRPDT